ncbi:hypothetical protein K2X85_05715 [bacterium]|nr:hypothetical protein [bacterium]
MAISQKHRTATLALLAGVMVLGFGGLQGYRLYQSQKAKSGPALASATKKGTQAKDSSSSEKKVPADPLPEVRKDTTPLAEKTPPAASADVQASLPTAADPPANPKEPISKDVLNLVGKMPPGKPVGEPDPRQTGGFLGEIFVRLDLNGDLLLEPMEIPTYYREQMLVGDASNDGQINFTEFRDSLARLPEPPAVRSTLPASALINPPAPGQEIPIYERAADRRAKDAPLWFTNYDRSGDGHIAVYEWPAGRLNEFRALDVNNDGFITLQEAKKAEQLKESMEPPTTPTETRPNASSFQTRPGEPASRIVGR